MPKLGMEPIRKAALVKATIVEIGRTGSLDVTVSQIAKRAGMSSALALADGPLARLRAILAASFSAANFRREAVGAWLNFWVLAQTVPEAKRLLRVYQSRLQSNLLAGLRPLAGDRAGEIAEGLGALIDGLYLRECLKSGAPNGPAAVAVAQAFLEAELAKAPE